MTSWGGISTVWIELATIAEAIERDAKWEFFINLSGMDYPIKTHKEITQFLGQNRGKSFIEHTYPTPKLLEAVHNYYIECSGARSPFLSTTFQPALIFFFFTTLRQLVQCKSRAQRGLSPSSHPEHT